MNKNMNVVVIGSCMIDLICYTDRLPRPGETIHGTKFKIGYGGKGANQCVAAAKLGAKTALVARLGDDSFGKEYKEFLEKTKVDTSNVTLTENTSSGMAQITVSEKGENQIVIVSGANKFLSISDIKNAGSTVLNAQVILFQFETPLATTIDALNYIRKTTEKGSVQIITNGAPAVSSVDPTIFNLSDIFCVNETEAEEICNIPVKNIRDAGLAIQKLISLGCNTVILTMGKLGVVYGSTGEGTSEATHVEAKQITPVDSTGAGDAFLGALAYFMSKHSDLSLNEKIRRACSVASFSVTREGTQTSYPTWQELPEQFFT